MSVILVDGQARTDLLPLTFARPVGALRLGILTLAEKWARLLDTQVVYHTEAHLQPLFPTELAEENLLLAANLLPTVELVSWLRDMPVGTAHFHGGRFLAARLDRRDAENFTGGDYSPDVQRSSAPHLPYDFLDRPADLFLRNGDAIKFDVELLTRGRESQPLPDSNTVIGSSEQLFIEEGVSIEGCTINVKDGPVYIGEGATVLEGGLFRGPLAICERAVVKMGAKIYGGTTIGPSCKVGGEISNVVFQANSNKGHDGYLGNAVIGEWCNIGADTNASNLKNDYGDVKVWSYGEERLVNSGLQFHGLIMADHCKTGINTMLNTGTVLGFSANVFGAGFPPSFVPCFSWGGGEGLQTYRLDKAMATAERMMSRRNEAFTPDHEQLFRHLFAQSERFR